MRIGVVRRRIETDEPEPGVWCARGADLYLQYTPSTAKWYFSLTFEHKSVLYPTRTRIWIFIYSQYLIDRRQIFCFQSCFHLAIFVYSFLSQVSLSGRSILHKLPPPSNLKTITSLCTRLLLLLHDIPNNIIPLTKKRVPILQRLLLLVIQILPVSSYVFGFRRGEG